MTTMSRLARTPELHRLLDSVAEGHVVHHSGCGAWPRGWSWIEGHMDNATQDLVDTLRHAGLIDCVDAGDRCGGITPSGVDRLGEWNQRYPKGGVA